MNITFQTKPKYLKAYGFIGESFEKEVRTKTKGLTLLHFAVIHGNEEMVKQLLDSGANVNVQDKRKWTPLHHASLLNNTSMMELLIQNGADTNALTDTQAKPSHLNYFSHFVKKISEETIPVLFKDKSLFFKDRFSYHPLTPQKYKELTGSNYLTDPYMNREYLIKEWYNKPITPDNFPFIEEIKDKYLDFRSGPKTFVPHTLYKVLEDSEGNLLRQSPGLGVFSSTIYRMGSVIGEYLGKTSEDGAKTPYTLGKTDSSVYSNEMSRINDGFPNVVMVPIFNCQGVSQRNVFVTSQLVNRYEQICWNYGFHSVKLGPYQELRPKALRQFVCEREHKGYFSSLLKKLVFNLGIKQDINFEDFIEVEKLRYLLSTPPAFFNLIIEGFLNRGIAEALWTTAFFPTMCIPREAPSILVDLASIGIQCRNYYESMKVWDSEKADKFLSELKEIIATKGIVQALEFARAFRSGTKTPSSEKKNVRMIRCDHFPERVGFFGIGRHLTKYDIGKKFFRAAPSGVDWSLVPLSPDIESAKIEKMYLLDITDQDLVFKDNHLSMTTSWSKQRWNDENWITLDDYLDFLKNYPLQDLKQVNIFNDPVAFNSSFNFKKKLNLTPSEQKWIEWVRKRLPEKPQNHTYQWKNVNCNHQQLSETVIKILKAKQLLQLDPTSEDRKLIRKQYFKLARQFHPDRPKGNEEKFKELKEAYEYLVNHDAGFELESLEAANLEDIYIKASKHFKSLQEQAFKKEDKFVIEIFDDFYKKLKTIPLKTDNKQLERAFTHLMGNCLEYCLCFKLKHKLETEFTSFAGTPQEIISEISLAIPKLKALISEFDLANKNHQWIILEQGLFLRANHLVLDKILAFNRTLAEAYLLQKDEKSALKIRKKALKHFRQQKNDIKKAIETFLDDSTNLKPKKLNNNPKESMDAKETSAPKRKSIDLPNDKLKNAQHSNKEEKRTTADEDRSEKPNKPPLQKPIPSDDDLLENNIIKNLTFFL